MTVLAEACSRGREDQVAWHLSRIPKDALAEELRAVDDWAGSTPLHWAAFAPTGAECVRLLIKAGAPVTLANGRDGSAAIHLAARYGRGEAVKVLVTEGGCDIDIENLIGNTALHECAFQGFPDVANALCALQAGIESSNRQGLTPLLAAAQAGHLEVVKILLAYGSRLDVAPPIQGQGRSMSITDSVVVGRTSIVRRARPCEQLKNLSSQSKELLATPRAKLGFQIQGDGVRPAELVALQSRWCCYIAVGPPAAGAQHCDDRGPFARRVRDLAAALAPHTHRTRRDGHLAVPRARECPIPLRSCHARCRTLHLWRAQFVSVRPACSRAGPPDHRCAACKSRRCSSCWWRHGR